MRIVYKSIVGSSDVMIYFWKILLQFGRFSWIRDVSYELNALFIPDNDAKTNSSFFFALKFAYKSQLQMVICINLFSQIKIRYLIKMQMS